MASRRPNRTIPRNDPGHNHLAGDFSDLLLLPNPAQYLIYDPLTTRPDPNRAGHVIRDSVPKQHHPRGSDHEPALQAVYRIPAESEPESDGVEPAAHQQLLRCGAAGSAEKPRLWRASRLQPLGPESILRARQRQQLHRRCWRLDLRERPGLHALSRVRKTRAGTGTWTRVSGDTVIDGQLSANRFLETDQRLGLKEYMPSGIGLPAYMDEFCQSSR